MNTFIRQKTDRKYKNSYTTTDKEKKKNTHYALIYVEIMDPIVPVSVFGHSVATLGLCKSSCAHCCAKK